LSVSKEKIDEILHSYPADQHYSLAIMQDLQHEFQYIPREGLEALVPYLNMPLSSLYSMATFYKALSLKPK
jgi:NADH-quinone oxidoreductase subunit E